MIQSEKLFSSTQPFIFASSPFSDTTPMDYCNFPCSFPSPGESSVFSSSSSVPAMFVDEFLDLDYFGNENQISPSMEGLEKLTEEIEDIYGWINGNGTEGNSASLLTVEENQWSPCLSQDSGQNSTVFPLTDMPLVLPEMMEVDDQLSLIHLLRAYAEAVENGQKELTEVIVKSINEKSSPVGGTLERVAYSLFQSREEQGEYIKQESSKNFLPAFRALYQSLPNSRFAHFTATTAILKSVPDDTETIHIVDFHVGEGIQWPLLIEALSWKQKQVWITSVKSEEGCTHTWWNFENTKKQLLSHARQYSVKLKIDEKGMGDLSNELMRQQSQGQGREWLVFNCMVGLPHMTGRRTRSVTKFLMVAKEFIKNRKGIIVVGDGEAVESLSICSSYYLYFDHLVRHYQALFESLQRNFPVHLTEARTAMENLFLSPFMCPEEWFKEWKEINKVYDLLADMQMEEVKHSQESIAVAKHLMSEVEDSYQVRTDIVKENTMVLQWKETQMVRVSTWM